MNRAPHSAVGGQIQMSNQGLEQMSDHQLYLSQVADVIRELFDEYDGPITLETTARDVPQWDSLSNVRLMVLIEQELAVRFSTAEVQGFKNLGSLIDAVVKRKQNQ